MLSSDHRRRTSGSISSSQAPRSLTGTPSAWSSWGFVWPGTKTSSNRPDDRRSIVASSLAIRTGLRAVTVIVVPSFSLRVTPAAKANPASGSRTPVVSSSESHRESKPHCSMRWIAAVNCSGSRPPRPTPIRIFIPGNYPGLRLQCAAVRQAISVSAAILMLAVLASATRADSGYSAALVRRSLEPPYRTQLDDSIYARSDCGPAVLGMVLDDFGVDQDTLELRRLTHTYQGTWPAVRVGTALQ